MSDNDNPLVGRIIEAMADAITSQAAAIESGPGHLKSVTIELELSNAGAVIDSTCWTERRGVHRAPAMKKQAS